MKSDVPSSGDYMKKYSAPDAKNKDFRNSALKELDTPSDIINKLFNKPEGTFDSTQEKEEEDVVEESLKSPENSMPKSRKKEYLDLLKKRMRTA